MERTFKGVVSDLTELDEVFRNTSSLSVEGITGAKGYEKFQDFRVRFFDWAARAELSVFHQWCSSQSQDWGKTYALLLEAAKGVISDLYLALSKLRYGNPGATAEKVEAQLARSKDGVGALLEFANDRMREAGPESYSYGGFKIENPYRFTDPVLHRLNAVLDWVKSLFKSRGVTPILNQTIRVIGLSWSNPSFVASGLYHHDELRIELYLDHISELSGRKSGHFRNFIRDVVLHEIAHHVHLYFLHPDAKKTWDSGWAGVAEAIEEVSKKTTTFVTTGDRGQFFELLRNAKGSLRSALSKLQGVDRVKFKFWLSHAWNKGETILESPYQLRVTGYGERVLEFIRDPKAYRDGLIESYRSVDEGGRAFERFREAAYDNLGLVSDLSVKVPLNVLEKDTVDPVSSAIRALDIPTAYGRKNYKEDFAETFVYFMLEPGKLSERALTRMQRALATSNLYGKPVMRISSRVADAYLQKHGATARVAMPHRGPYMFREQVIRFERVADNLFQHRVKFESVLEDAISTLRSGGDMRSGSPEALAVKLLEDYAERVALMPNLFPENEWAAGDYSAMQWPEPLLDAAERYYRK